MVIKTYQNNKGLSTK